MDPKQRDASAEKADNRDPKTGQFGTGNNAGTGGRSGYENAVRKLLREDCHTARNLLRATMEGKALDGRPDAEITHDQKLKAAEVTLKYGVGPPKQTHKVEHRGGAPLAGLTAEALVAFVKGANGQ